MNYARITPCGECCDGCAKQLSGQCRGCIETDGQCEEWAGSGCCPLYRCAREHGTHFCGVCSDFPCSRLPEMLRWRPDCIAELRKTAAAFHRWLEESQ